MPPACFPTGPNPARIRLESVPLGEAASRRHYRLESGWFPGLLSVLGILETISIIPIIGLIGTFPALDPSLLREALDSSLLTLN